MELTHVDITGLLVLHAALVIFPVRLPTTLIDRPIDVDYLADTIFDEKLVLAEVNVSVGVEQLADRATVAVLEFTLEDDSLVDKQACHAVESVILEASSVLVPVRHDHLALMPLVSLPDSLEGRTIAPGHDTIAVALAGFKVASILGLLALKATTSGRLDTVIVLHDTEAIRSPILECAPEVILRLIVEDLGQRVKPAILKVPDQVRVVLPLFHLLLEVAATGHWLTVLFQFLDVLG